MRTSLISVVTLLLALVLPSPGLTQPVPDDPYPFRPADTSSPRDTLHSFLTNANQAIQLWRSGAPLERIAKRRNRTVETLDFSQVVDNHLMVTKTRHVLLLKEILDRIPLPPDDQIPGDQEVADQGITRWTIPDTEITIAQVKDGPREGEFLFRARFVADLEDIYLNAKHLPYQPGATEGVYDRFLEEEGLSGESTAGVRYRLRPIDTSDPRSTFLGFRETLERAYLMIMDADAAFKADPPTMSRQEGLAVEQEASILIQRAMKTLDLSQIPKAIRDDIGTEVALQLKEVLDRVPGTYLDAIPDAEAVRAWKRANKDVLLITPEPFRWYFPNTEIAIVEVTDGPRRGEFLFSAETVSRAEEFYKTMEDLPYRPGATEGFYTFFISTPGYLVPEAHPLTRWIDALPPAFTAVYADQTVWQWVGLALSGLAIIIAVGLVSSAIRRLSRRVGELIGTWLRLLLPIFVSVITLGVYNFLNRGLNITGYLLTVVTNISETVVYLMAVWGIFILFEALAETVIASPRMSKRGLDASLLRLAARLMGFLIGGWVLIEGVKELGIDVVPLLAGLGVGGLALALAARPTLANVIGSLMIHADKPYSIGQRVNVLGHMGNVESIGLRSTKIRLLNGHLTTIPNEKMASEDIENIGLRPHIRRTFNITITYDTPPAKINRAVEIVREILAVPQSAESMEGDSAATSADMATVEGKTEQPPHPNEAINHPDFPTRVFFNEFNADSLNILVVYWYHPPDYWDYVEHAHWINVQIMERFNAEGIDFAFPTQTLHLAGDDKRPLTVGQRRVSEDEHFPHGAVLAQAPADGAQLSLADQIPASESARPRPREFVGPPPPPPNGKLKGPRSER